MIKSPGRLLFVLISIPVFVASVLAVPVEAGKTKTKRSPVLTAAYGTKYQFDPRVQLYLTGIVNNWQLGIAGRNPAILTMFESQNKPNNGGLLPWSGEFAGKYLTGAVEILRLTDDPQLKAYLEKFVKELVGLQEENGYLGPWTQEHQLKNTKPGTGSDRYTWDAWNHYHLMIGLTKWYELTGDKEALAAVEKIGTLVCETFYDKPNALLDLAHVGWTRGSQEFNLTMAHSLMELYQFSGKERYLAMSRQIIDEALLSYGNYLKLGVAGKPFHRSPGFDSRRWERVHILSAMPHLYWVTGDEDYRKAHENLWWSLLEFDCHNTLGFTTDEVAIGDTYGRGNIETCCAVAYNAMSVDMLKTTGNSVVADVIEVMHLNALRGAQDISGKWSTYHTGTEGIRKPNTVDIAFQNRPGSEELNCCSVNTARGFGLISEWALMKDESGLILNWYGESDFQTKHKGIDVQIKQQTSYPSNGQVRIHVAPSKATEFDLRLRIPFWSKNTKIKVNSKVIPSPQPGRYLSLNRKWQQGDVIELLLDMAVAYWPGEQGRSDHASFYYGPLLLAFRPGLRGEIETIGEIYPVGPSYKSGKPGAAVKFKVLGDQFKVYCDKDPNAGQVGIRIDGRLAEKIDLYHPHSDVPLCAAFDNLGPGEHEVVITVLEKSEKSNNNRVRFRIVNYDLPVCDMTNFRWGPVETKDASALVTIECEAQNGDTFNLVDFDSAGWNDQFYVSWLPVVQEKTGTFSRDNPLRLIRTARE
ncbi:MAG: hypothetical protein CMJ81_09760 [Planctomycetaceae bacterium]|nr:hypothetical protein [Planctomycetaceae bacterium]